MSIIYTGDIAVFLWFR